MKNALPLLLVFACGNKAAGYRPACDKIVTASIADAYFAGYVLSASPGALPSIVSCTYRKAGPKFDKVELVFICNQGMSQRMASEKGEYKETWGGVDVPGIGRGAVKVGRILRVWDDDTDCTMTLDPEGNGIEEDPMPLARDLVNTLTPASVR